MSFKQKLAGTALAVSALTGAGVGATALADNAGAATVQSVHWSAHYKSSSQCNYYRNGAIRAHLFNGGVVTYAGRCSYNYPKHYWTYGHVTYTFYPINF